MGREDRPFTSSNLYGSSGKPQASDIQQDDLYNCYLLAPMGALADRQPERISDMISYGPSQAKPDENVFAVMLHRPDGTRVRIEVSSAEVQDNIRRDGGSRADNRDGAPIWPAVIETAFAKLHDPNPSNGSLDDAYRYVGKQDGGGALDDGMFALTGDAGRRLRITGGPTSTLQGSSTRTNPNDTPTFSAHSNRREDMTEEQAYSEVRTALENGRPVTLSTRTTEVNDGLFEGHGYAVTGIERRDDGHAWVTLRNPYAHNRDPGGNESGNTSNASISVRLDRIVASGAAGEFNIGPSPALQGQPPQSEITTTPGVPATHAIPPAPATPPSTLLNNPNHPDHGLYQQVLTQTVKLPREGRPVGQADQIDQQLSAALAVQCREAGMTCVNHVVLSSDGKHAFAVDTADITAEWRKRADVSVSDAIRQPLDGSTQRMATLNQELAQQALLERQHSDQPGLRPPGQSLG